MILGGDNQDFLLHFTTDCVHLFIDEVQSSHSRIIGLCEISNFMDIPASS